jgi:hypothetical protein
MKEEKVRPISKPKKKSNIFAYYRNKLLPLAKVNRCTFHLENVFLFLENTIYHKVI